VHARPEGNEDDTAKTDDAKLRPILSSKLFLYVTEFFSGMGVMAAELGASRLLIVDELPGHRRVSCMPIFVTIPAVGTFVTFPIFSGPLLALALVYFLAARAWTGTCGDTPGLGVW